MKSVWHQRAQKARKSGPFWLLFIALDILAAATLPACRWLDRKTWVSDGGELGARVRNGKLKGFTHHTFNSPTLGKEVGLVVATPPEFQKSGDRRYPVVYVFPGIQANEWTYLADVGPDSPVLKALFKNPARAPIVVFAHHGDSAAAGDGERVLAEELVAYVDSHYPTIRAANGRSLEGFSLGGATALRLLTLHSQTFGRAVAMSSACYLLRNCDKLRSDIRERAGKEHVGSVLLAVGERENEDNRRMSEELAPLFDVKLVRVPKRDHEWAAQLSTKMGEETFGEKVAAFHLAGFVQ